jgi:hypothetical protein
MKINFLNNQNLKFRQNQNFVNFGTGQKATLTDTERDCIPKPIPKGEKLSLKNTPF